MVAAQGIEVSGSGKDGGEGLGSASGKQNGTEGSFMLQVDRRHRVSRPNPRFEKFKKELLNACSRDIARNKILARLNAAQAMHRTHLTMQVANLAMRSSAACSAMLQGILLSTIPPKLTNRSMFRDLVREGDGGKIARVGTLPWMAAAMLWFRHRFQSIPEDDYVGSMPRDWVSDEDYLVGLLLKHFQGQAESGSGKSQYQAKSSSSSSGDPSPLPAEHPRMELSSSDYAQLFACFVRSVGIPCRLVCLVDPFDVQGYMKGKVAEARSEAKEITGRAKVSRVEGSKELQVTLEAAHAKSSSHVD